MDADLMIVGEAARDQEETLAGGPSLVRRGAVCKICGAGGLERTQGVCHQCVKHFKFTPGVSGGLHQFSQTGS